MLKGMMNMSYPIIRPSRQGDEPALKKIWKEAFHDEESLISDFFKNYYTPRMATVLEYNGEPVSAFYTFYGITLDFPNLPELACPYGYSLGTLPECRGRGWGAELTREGARRVFGEGYRLFSLLPADDKLRRWYEKVACAHTAFFLREKNISTAELQNAPSGCKVTRVPPEEYNRLRNAILSGYPHARFDDKLVRWQERLSTDCGGGLYMLENNGAIGCAIAQYSYSDLVIKDLLFPGGNLLVAAAAIAELHPGDGYIVRSPLFFGGEENGEKKDFTVVISPEEDTTPFVETAYWGLAFD